MLSLQVHAVTFTTAREREKLVFVAPEPTEHGGVPVHRSQTLNRWSYTATQRPTAAMKLNGYRL